ncbi:MAG TPA: penicillin-binding protein activator, partial [Gammaproteobacteria bacterium]|nr:penicillin-binding protein activator [Gammaproteobacteria bacterium]
MFIRYSFTLKQEIIPLMIKNFIGIVVSVSFGKLQSSVRFTRLLFVVILCIFPLTSCKTSHSIGSDPAESSTQAHKNPVLAQSSEISWQGNSEAIWTRLQHTSITKLQTNFDKTADPTKKSWLKLAMIYQTDQQNTKALVSQLMTWRQDNPNHPANDLIPNDATLDKLLKNPSPKHIALLLPLAGQYATQGHIVRDGFLSAYYESLSRNPGQTVTFYDTGRNSDIHFVYQKAIHEGADLIIGPLTKQNVFQLSHKKSHPVTTIALNYTDQTLPKNFYEFGLSPKDEAIQLANKAREMGHSKAIIIAPKDDWSQRIVKPLLDQWQSVGGQLTDSYYYSLRANFAEDIPNLLRIENKNSAKKDLLASRRKDFDVVFLVAQPDEGREIVPLLRHYEVSNIPIYSTSMIYAGAPSPEKDTSLNGVIFCDIPWLLNKNHKGSANR